MSKSIPADGLCKVYCTCKPYGVIRPYFKKFSYQLQFIIFIQRMDDDDNLIVFLPKADDNSSKLTIQTVGTPEPPAPPASQFAHSTDYG